MDEAVTIGKDEALVLFELLWGFRDQPALLIRDNAQRAALWDICATLEKALHEPFLEDYSRILEEAKQRLTSRYGLSPR